LTKRSEIKKAVISNLKNRALPFGDLPFGQFTTQPKISAIKSAKTKVSLPEGFAITNTKGLGRKKSERIAKEKDV
jgi:hypothetical protein